MSIARYIHCRDSGIPWLGTVPTHWRIKRLKHLCTIFPSNVDKHAYEDEPPVLLCNYTDVYYNDRITRDIPFMAATASPDQVSKFTLRAGDTIITKDSETADDIAISAYVPEDLDGVICGYHLSLVRAHEGTRGAFVKRVFDSAYARACFEVAANGLTRVGLSQYAIDNFVLAVPPLEEQDCIVRFLDRETAKIDDLIGEQRRLIDLLNEKRRAIIARAVTNGLDRQAPMRDSGIEWLGAAPRHWECIRLGAVFREAAEPGNDELPLLSVSIHHGVSDKEFDEDELERKVTRSDDRSKYIRVKPGDLVYNMMRAWQGGFGTVKVEGMVSPAYVVARPKIELNTEFVEQLLRTSRAIEELRRHSHGVTDFRLRLYWDEFKSIRIALPPLKEQRTILEFLRGETAKIDALVSETENAISLLQERRAALISAAVTGKIDVRELVEVTPKREAAA